MKRKISVFIASPGDLSKERECFREVIVQLNSGFGDGAGVEFEALGWEDTLASTGPRVQDLFNKNIDKCDVFILAMNRRWGQDAPDAEPFSSYTEEEFNRALARYEEEGKPEIFVFFKLVDPESEADPGPQLKKVMAFRKQLEDSKKVLYHYFDDNKSFSNEVDRHLRAYAKDELPKLDKEQAFDIPIELMMKIIERVRNDVIKETKKAEEPHDANRVLQLKIENMQLEMAEDAANLAKEGKIEFARQKFSTLVVEPSNLRILFLAYEFYYRTGDLDSAFSVLDKWLSLSGSDETSAETAAAFGNLGSLYQVRGKYKDAEEMYQKALFIDESLDDKEGMANQYNNLGSLYRACGELDLAEKMCKKALDINEVLGRKGAMAYQYGNLGAIYKDRGHFECAEDMYREAFKIDEELGNQEGMAIFYSNLGVIYMERGELDLAENMYKKALEINKKLDRKQGIANQYCNLGVIYHKQMEFNCAENMYKKALEINKELGRKEGIANQYCNLGTLFSDCGKFNRAEKMYQKSCSLFNEIQSPNAKKVEGLLNDLRENMSPVA